jgi:hypothetical protein
MKRLKIILSILGLFNLNNNLNGSSQEVRPEESNQDTVVVFDIHDVITKNPNKYQLCSNAFSIMDFKYIPHFAKKALQYGKKWIDNKIYKTPEKSFESVALEERASDPKYVKQAIAVMNQHEPILKTVAILEQLKAQGYPIYGCSNIGILSYQYMQDKYPEVFKNLEACRTTNQDNQFRKKKDPQAKAYLETLDLINQKTGTLPKRIILIDDKISNINQAQDQIGKSVKIEPILFSNPDKLQTDLDSLIKKT